jgi:UDP-N-acetylglucosamine diphosphorylase/glucosamine-1-phosphate N-acetyltransferase
MPPIYVFEDSHLSGLFPLTYALPACWLRCGAFTLLERLQRHLPGPVAGVLVREPLAAVLRKRTELPINPAISTGDGIVLVNARWLMTKRWELPAVDSVGITVDSIAWAYLSGSAARELALDRLTDPAVLEKLLPKLLRQPANATLIGRPWELIDQQPALLVSDFAAFGAKNEATGLGPIHLIAPEKIHLAKDVTIYPNVVIDASAGPVVVEAGTKIQANAVLTGPLYIGKNCHVRTGADVRENNAFGDGCRMGGEIIGSIFGRFANKQHHGFVGQSIVGEFANFGAGSTTSNLKNTYGTVRMPLNGVETETGRQFLGSLIGDHAKLGIGTYLSTGSVVGYGSQVAISRPPKFVPSLAFVTSAGIARLDFEKFEAVAKAVLQRRNLAYETAEHELSVAIAGDWAVKETFDWDD